MNKQLLRLMVLISILFSALPSVAQAREGAAIEGKIVFHSNRGGKEGLYLYDGSSIKFLGHRGYYPAWFSNGERLLSITARSTASIIDINGKVLETIDTALGRIDILKPVIIEGDKGFIFSGIDRLKNKDGTEMSKGISNLYRYDFQTREIINLTSFAEAGDILSFDLSPGNDWIAFTWGPPDKLTTGYFFNVKTKEKIKFADQVHMLQWGKDGKIYYDSGVPNGQTGKIREGWAGFFAYDPKTKKSQLILDNFGLMGFDFSPDGKKIIYSDFYAKGMFLFILDLETKKREPLLSAKQMSGEGINDTDPAWHA